MACSISEGVENGVATIELRNPGLSITLTPEAGGKIWKVVDHKREINWIWHNPLSALCVHPLGASYDDNWAGGWEELFPNDSAATFDGRELPDHGEWWSAPWKAEIIEQSRSRVAVRMSHNCRSIPAACEKTVVLEEGSSRVAVSYLIRNLHNCEIEFLLKQHLAVRISPEGRIELPGGTVTPVSLEFSKRIGSPGPFQWPYAVNAAGQQVDLSEIPPPSSELQEFVYVSDLPEGWCGVRDTRSGAAIRLRYSKKVFPYCWLFMTFGGWRGHYTVVLEPCTNMPKDLGEASRVGQCAHLAPGEILETEVVLDVM